MGNPKGNDALGGYPADVDFFAVAMGFVENTSAFRPQQSGNCAQHRCFTGPIGTDQADQFPLADLDAVICQGRDAAETLFQTFNF